MRLDMFLGVVRYDMDMFEMHLSITPFYVDSVKHFYNEIDMREYTHIKNSHSRFAVIISGFIKASLDVCQLTNVGNGGGFIMTSVKFYSYHTFV